MPLPAPPPLPSSPADAVRLTLIRTLYKDHRPELAELLVSADFVLDAPGVWVSLPEKSLSPAWLEEKLFAAAVAAGIPFAWLHVLAGGRGEEP